jgi:hypothetical protein
MLSILFKINTILRQLNIIIIIIIIILKLYCTVISSLTYVVRFHSLHAHLSSTTIPSRNCEENYWILCYEYYYITNWSNLTLATV